MAGVSTQTYRRTLPLLITFVGGMILLLEYFLGGPIIGSVAGELRSWAVIIFGFTVLLGMSSLVMSHLRRINTSRRASRGQTFYSAWLVTIFLIFMILGIVLPGGIRNRNYGMLYDAVYAVLAQALWALNGFWVTLAIFRALRGRSLETWILIFAGAFTMFGLAPWGEVIWPGFVTIKDWILNFPFTGGMRAITLAAGVGVVVTCIRTLLGRETGYLGRR